MNKYQAIQSLNNTKALHSKRFGVQIYLVDLHGCSIGIVTEKALRAELRPYIKREAIDV